MGRVRDAVWMSDGEGNWDSEPGVHRRSLGCIITLGISAIHVMPPMG